MAVVLLPAAPAHRGRSNSSSSKNSNIVSYNSHDLQPVHMEVSLGTIELLNFQPESLRRVRGEML